MSPRHYSDWDGSAPRPRRRPADGGVRSRSRRGQFANSWWGQRFLGAVAELDPYDGPSRLQRGRTYARQGQVVEIDIRPGKVVARVQGSRPRPYRVQVSVTPLTEAEWRRAAQVLADTPADAARLLAGELPQAAEQAFRTSGGSLFPGLSTECSCPDWANPCKHVAAVCYLVAEEFDRDPFLLLRLIGVERSAFVAAVTHGDQTQDEAVAGGEPVAPADPGTFWGGPAPTVTVAMSPPAVAAPLLSGLDAVPFWRGGEGLADVVRSLLKAASDQVVTEAIEAAVPDLDGEENAAER